MRHLLSIALLFYQGTAENETLPKQDALQAGMTCSAFYGNRFNS